MIYGLQGRRLMGGAVIGLLLLTTVGSLRAEAATAWVPAADMLYARTRHTATVLTDGRVLVVGGHGRDRSGNWHSPIREAETYDPSKNSWSSAGWLAVPRSGHTATLLLDGRVLVVGGTSPPSFRTVEIFDPTTGSWSTADLAPAARHLHSATLLATGKVLVVGGRPDQQATGAADLFDPSSGRWTPAASMRRPRSSHTASLLGDGRILVVGGNIPRAGVPPPMDGAEIYDPISDSWTLTAETTEAWSGSDLQAHRANLLPDGTVMVSGGCCVTMLWPYPPGPPPGQGQWTPPVPTPSQIYDPRSNVWSPAPSATPRFRHEAVTLPDGRVLVIGGFLRIAHNYGRHLATTETYDMRTRMWTDGPSMQQTRMYFAAVVLRDGRVLAIGGDADDDGNTVRSVEILESGIGAPTPQDDAGSGDDAGDTFETATLVTLRGFYTGRLDVTAEDRSDFYRFFLPEGGWMSVLVDTYAVTTDPIELIAPDGTVLDVGVKALSNGVSGSAVFSNEAPRVRLAIHRAPVSGDYRLHVRSDRFDLGAYTLCFMNCEGPVQAPIEFVFDGSLKHGDANVLLVPPVHGDLGNPLGPTALDYLKATLRGIHKWTEVMDRFASDYPEYGYLREIDVRVEIFDEARPVDPAGYDVILGYVAAGPVFRGVAADEDDSVEALLSEWGLGEDVRFSGRVIALSLFGSSPRAGQVLYDSPESTDLEMVTTHEFAHTFGLGHTKRWDPALGPDLMNSPAPFVYGDGSPVGDGGERTSIACISTLDLVGMAELYRWISDGSWYGPSESSVELPADVPYAWYC